MQAINSADDQSGVYCDIREPKVVSLIVGYITYALTTVPTKKKIRVKKPRHPDIA
jgi:hypothetical protein